MTDSNCTFKRLKSSYSKRVNAYDLLVRKNNPISYPRVLKNEDVIIQRIMTGNLTKKAKGQRCRPIMSASNKL